MTDENVDCYNCGRANPAWAQVCRSCGTPMRAAVGSAAASGPIPRDRDSLVSIGLTLAAIVAAIVVGVMLSGMLPETAPVVRETATPDASLTATPRSSGAADPSAEPPEATAAPTPAPTPALIGTVTFGTGINPTTREATGLTDTFTTGTAFCHSVQLTEPFGVDAIQEEVLRVEPDGTLTVVQRREQSNLRVPAGSQIAGFCAPDTGPLIEGWGEGSFVLRDYRGADTPELIAEGQFTLTR